MESIKPYYDWKKRKILIYNFEGPMAIGRDCIEASLRKMQIPLFVYDFFDPRSSRNWILEKEEMIGIIFTGAHNAVDEPFCPYIPKEILQNDLPKLGICYGHELLGKLIGAEIVKCNTDSGEKVDSIAELDLKCMLFDGLSEKEIVPMKHNNMLRNLPENADCIAKTSLTPIAGFECKDMKIWGIQFHPEKNYLHQIIYRNFVNYCYRLYHPETRPDENL